MHERQYIVDDLTKDDTWRMFNILAEFVEGFDVLPEVYPAVTIFDPPALILTALTTKRRKRLPGYW